MMRHYPWILRGLIACGLMIASCAPMAKPLPVAPPLLTLPVQAQTPCDLPQLPVAASLADLEVGYVERGEALVACDLARQLAVETLVHERALIAAWQARLARTGQLVPTD